MKLPLADEGNKKSRKKIKMSLKRQMTIRRNSTLNFLSQQTAMTRRQSVAVGDQSPFSGSSRGGSNKELGNRHSLTVIKDNANKAHGRQSMLVTQMKGIGSASGASAANKHKSVGIAIEEQSEDEDSNAEGTEQKMEAIQEFEDDDDPFKQVSPSLIGVK